MYNKNRIANFNSYTKSGENGCIIWIGGTSKGYGYFWTGDKLVRANRFALEVKLGRKINEGFWALHNCDNALCVNPEHLYEGTPYQNVMDCINRNRWGRPAGRRENHGKFKKTGLNENKIKTIKEYLETHSRQEASKKFKISLSTVRNIDLNEHWLQS